MSVVSGQSDREAGIYALRHTFGAQLSKIGVAPRTGHAALRHLSLALTMNGDTGPRLSASGADILPLARAVSGPQRLP